MTTAPFRAWNTHRRWFLAAVTSAALGVIFCCRQALIHDRMGWPTTLVLFALGLVLIAASLLVAWQSRRHMGRMGRPS